MRTGHKFNKLLVFNGDSLDQMVLQHPFNESDIPILIDNEVTTFHGTGIDGIWPAHDMRSLKVAYHYGLEKEGFVNENGLIKENQGPIFQGLNVFDEKTNDLVMKMLMEEDSLMCQYQFKNEFYENVENGEKIILRSTKSWFIEISDKLKAQCFDALSTASFLPGLNIKDTEEIHKDHEKIKKRKGKNRKKKAIDEDIGSYYMNILEELTDFNDWCISEKGNWGIPIPFFRFNDTGKILMDPEIIDHFAKLVEENGTSDIWYSMAVEDLLPMRYKP